jgi:OOP family OmpA-OmpF porin
MNRAIIPLWIGQLLLVVLTGNISEVLAADEPLHIEVLQRRAEKLSFDRLDPNNYHLAKARTWLNLAADEYYDKDDSGIVPAAVNQAVTLLDALEHRQTTISMDTPMNLPGSEMVRPDLWDKIAGLKKQSQFSCGQRPAAEAEIYLVWAGHEKFESGWSHAESYLRGAEDRIYAAQVAIKNCTELPKPVMEKITLSTDALFALDQTMLEPSALWRLNKLTDSIKQMDALEEIVLVGHTDRLHINGNQQRNQSLSERRAKSIRQYLIGKGIPADKIHASGAGSTQPIVQCSTRTSKKVQVECLQPNRRVEIVLRGRKTADAGTGNAK